MAKLSMGMAVLGVLIILSIIAYLRYPGALTGAIIIGIIGGYVTIWNVVEAF